MRAEDTGREQSLASPNRELDKVLDKAVAEVEPESSFVARPIFHFVHFP